MAHHHRDGGERAFRHSVGIRTETDGRGPLGRHVLYGDHCLDERAGCGARRQGFQLEGHLLARVTDPVRDSGELKGLRDLTSVEDDACRHADIVGIRRPALIGLGERDGHLPFGVIVQGEHHLHGAALCDVVGTGLEVDSQGRRGIVVVDGDGRLRDAPSRHPHGVSLTLSPSSSTVSWVANALPKVSLTLSPSSSTLSWVAREGEGLGRDPSQGRSL